VPYVELTRYDGVTSDRVKIGTIKRSKGLEFKFVLLPGLRRGAPELWPGETGESYAERCERSRREQFVAMTRARDGLWLGYLEPTPTCG
jgi:superfamily I DNA/RNA helicase